MAVCLSVGLVALVLGYGQGELVELWFDGGTKDPKLGAKIPPLLQELQPKAVCFQGPTSTQGVRWAGSESGHAILPNWYDTTVPALPCLACLACLPCLPACGPALPACLPCLPSLPSLPAFLACLACLACLHCSDAMTLYATFRTHVRTALTGLRPMVPLTSAVARWTALSSPRPRLT
jgi:hypothetical protein